MDKNLLIRLLSTSTKVILPGFGAFLRKSKESHPVFTPFLRSDDDFLAGEVSEEYGVSVEDASEMVAAFIVHIKETIERNGSFYFEGVGTLSRDVNGAISFVMDLSKQIPTEAEAVSNTTPAPAPQPVEQPVVEVFTEKKVEPAAAPPPVPPAAPVRPEPVFPKQPKVQFPPQQPKPSPSQEYTTPQFATPVTPRPVTPKPIVGVPKVQFTPAKSPTTERVVATPQPQRPQPISRPAMAHSTVQRPTTTVPVQPQKLQPQPQPQPQQQPQPQPQKPRQQSDPNRQLSQSPQPARKNKKGDMWLVIAIVAAVVVIGLMVYGILTAQEVENTPFF